MNVLFEEQDSIVIERSAENTLPAAIFDGMKIHHESFDLKNLQESVNSIGGEVISEGYHV